MPAIEITVAGKIAQVQGNPVIVCGNSDYTVQFTFDSEWNGYAAKTARFNFVQNGVRLYYDVLFEGSSCTVPVLNDVYEVEIGVYAGDIHTSTPVRVPCVRSATDGAAQHPDPPPDVYEQLMDYLENLGGGGGVAGEAALHTAGAFGGVAGKIRTPNLPYIQSSGAQGIRCDFTPSSTDVKYELKYADNVPPDSNTWQQLFGGYVSNMRPGGIGSSRSVYGNNLVCCIGNGERLTGIGFTKGGYHELTVQISGNDVTVTFDGMTFADTWAGSISCPVGLCCGATASGTQEYSTVKVYGFKIWEGGTLRRDFSPATVNGRAGFYDAVSETMFYSVTGTDFEYVPAETEE